MIFDKINKMYNDKHFIEEYEHFHRKKYPSIENVNGLPIHFDKSFNRIGISLSGGADSSLLFYILCKLIQDNKSNCKILPTTVIRFYDTKPWLPNSAKKVYTWMKKRFPNIVMEHDWNFIPPELEVVKLEKLGLKHLDKLYDTNLMFCDVLFMTTYKEFLIRDRKLDYLYSGTTMNPPKEFHTLDAAGYGGNPEFRSHNTIIADKISEVISNAVINPFALIQKDYTMAQYENFKIQDLLSLTRSCEANELKIGVEWTDGDVDPPVCGTCFFCQERQWGTDNQEKFLIK